jgi:hypothetical protein
LTWAFDMTVTVLLAGIIIVLLVIACVLLADIRTEIGHQNKLRESSKVSSVDVESEIDKFRKVL